MIAKGNSRSNAKFFVRHLLKGEDNERVTVREIQGFIADNVPDAFKEMEIIAAGSSTKNYMYHLNLSPRPDETLTPEQWTEAVDTAAKELGLENQPRLVIEHEKKGRVHEHVIWLRLDDNLNAISDSWNYQAHDRIREQLEQRFNHEPTPPTPEPALRKSREFAEWEQWRGTESGIDPKAMKAEITALYHASDNGAAFQGALEHSGYTMCRGDKQGVLCIVDSAGDSHALLRRINGLRAAELRAFMADVDPQNLPSVAEAIQLVKAQPESESGDSAARVLPQEQAQEVTNERGEPSHNPKLAVLEKLIQEPPGHTEIDARAAWFAENLPDTYPAATTLADHAATIEQEMRVNDCELPLAQGRTWELWADHARQYFQERAESVPETVHERPPELQERLDHLKDTVTQVKDRLSTFWQDFIKEGREREPPEIQEPELER